MLSCVGGGLATGVLLTLCKIHSFRLILMGNGPEGIMQKDRRKEEEGGDPVMCRI
jgi:hypothetical protein